MGVLSTVTLCIERGGGLFGVEVVGYEELHVVVQIVYRGVGARC